MPSTVPPPTSVRSARAVAAEPAAGTTTPARRVAGLDVARGVVVLLAVFATALTGRYAQHHADWYGQTPLDLIFPSFVTLTGASVALTLRRPLRVSRLARRTAVLVLVGLAFNAAVGSSGVSSLRIPGVLQLIAVVGLVVTVLGRIVRRWWGLLLVVVTVFAADTVLLLSSSRSCPGGLPQPHCNLSGRLDRAVFGSTHTYGAGANGYDPEGLLSTLGALGCATLGLLAGAIVVRRRGVVPTLLVLAAGSAAASLLLAQWLPVNKRLWDPAFATRSSAAAIVLLAACYLVVDVLGAGTSMPARGIRGAAWPLVACGRNSLLVYVGKHFLPLGLAAVTLSGRTLEQHLHGWVGGAGDREPLAYAAAISAFWLLVAAVLHRRRWYLRA